MHGCIRSVVGVALLCGALGLPAAAAAHDGVHPTEPVAQGHRLIDGDRAAFAYHSDAIKAVPDELVTTAVARDDMADLPEAGIGTAEAALPETWCGDAEPALAAGQAGPDDTTNAVFAASAPQFKVIYAYAADQASRFATLADRLQANVSLLSRFVAGQAAGTKTLRFDMGTSCGAQYADIQVVHLPQNLAAYLGPDFDALDTDIRAAVAGSQPGPHDWLVYGDRMRSGGVAGTAQLYYGSSADAPDSALHDAGRLVAAVWGPAALPASAYADPTTMLHEMGHNLGAVQDSAPHSTGYAHCTDEWDVMCYADGDPTSALTYPCPKIGGAIVETFDCGGDDYFNAAPVPGSWLAEHWNVYSSAMLGACTGVLAAACDVGDAPVNTTPAAPAGWRATAYAVAISGLNTTQRQWRVDGGSASSTGTATVSGEGLHLLETRVGSAGGVWTAWRPEAVRIDSTPPEATVTCPEQWAATVAACTAAAADGLAPVQAIQYSANGGAPVTVGAGPFATGGGAVRARATNATGLQSDWSAPATARVDDVVPSVSVACAPLNAAQFSCRAPASDDQSGLAAVTLTTGGPAFDAASGQSVTVTAPAKVVARAVDAVGNAMSAAQLLQPAPAPGVTPKPVPTRTIAVPVADRRGRVKGKAELRILSAGAGRSATLTLGRIAAPRGTWKLTACLRQAGRKAKCTTRRSVLRRAGRLPGVVVESSLSSGDVQASVDVARRAGRRYAKPALLARASAG